MGILAPEALPQLQDAQNFRDSLIAWGAREGRRFPWRETRDPYPVLLAEVLLHRTRASQVVPLFERVLDMYPDVPLLAAAPLGQLHVLLYAAGLRWRVDLLHEMAVAIMERFGGRIPESEDDLLSLPGVGHYIASAVRCFALGKPDAILDTNTVRVIGRVFAMAVNDSSRRSSRFRHALQPLVDPEQPREFNFALLDLAAAICTPKDPRCEVCPLLPFCRTGAARVGGVRSGG
jgi:A/G-specific adenine glycosylase